MRRGQTERLFAWAARQKRKIGLIKMIETVPLCDSLKLQIIRSLDLR